MQGSIATCFAPRTGPAAQPRSMLCRPLSPPPAPTCFLGSRLAGTGPSSSAKAGEGGTASASPASASECLLPRNSASRAVAPPSCDLTPICEGGGMTVEQGAFKRTQGTGTRAGPVAVQPQGHRSTAGPTRRRCTHLRVLVLVQLPPSASQPLASTRQQAAARTPGRGPPAGTGPRTGCRWARCTACGTRPPRRPSAGWAPAPRRRPARQTRRRRTDRRPTPPPLPPLPQARQRRLQRGPAPPARARAARRRQPAAARVRPRAPA